MNNKRIPFLLLCSSFLTLSSSFLAAQLPDPEYKNYHWDDNPKLHALSNAEQKMGIVLIKDKRMIEYYQTEKDVVMYITRHNIIRVNSDKAVEESNTVYISVPDGVSVVDLHARAISKDGKVIDLNPANIKDVDNYQNQGPFKIFAIDGIEIGGEVEWLYTLLCPSRKYGTETVRVNALCKNFSVDIYSPPAFIFEAKSYNGFPIMLTDTTMNVKRRIYAEATDLKGFDREEFSLEAGALMRMEYKYAYNANSDPNERIDTWSSFCQNIYEVFNKGVTKEDKKIAQKVIDTLETRHALSLSEESRICRIESKMKNTIALKADVGGKDYDELKNILKNHVTDEIGMLKLYDLLFNAAGIKHEIVITSNRFDKPFDGDFDSWTYLQKYLFYFPDTKKYIAPMEPLSRYGFVPADWICQQGLFMHPVTIGKDFNTGIGEVKEMDCNDWKLSMNNLYENTKFDLDMGVANIHFKQSTTGYETYPLSYYSYLSDQDKKDVIDRAIKEMYFPDAKPANVTVSGYKEDELYRQPFTIETDISTNSILEQAGNKFLFKIGLMIGPQSELYQDTARHTAVENHYNHGYHRELSFEIPDGYRVTNLNAVNMDVYHSSAPLTTGSSADGRDMEFHSYYKTEGNKITVIIDEDYRQIRYPVSMYEEFRKVINTSADFNKVVLFIEKKSNP